MLALIKKHRYWSFIVYIILLFLLLMLALSLESGSSALLPFVTILLFFFAIIIGDGWILKQKGISLSNDISVEQCFVCGNRNPVTAVTYKKHTGMVAIGTTKTYRGYICEKCNNMFFHQCLKHCLIKGWWGIISLFVWNPISIVGNILNNSRVNKRFRKYSKLKANTSQMPGL